MSTLHLRCGDDLRDILPRAGIAGDYLCFSDPVCVGPARDEGDLIAWLGLRARFVALHAGQDVGQVRLRLGREYTALNGLHRHDAVHLWFEHDLWDQAALIRILSLLAEKRQLRGRLWLMPADGLRSFPELPDAALAALQPAPLTDLQIEQGAEAWDAFSAPDPRALDALTRRKLTLPFLAAAMRRHLRDLPWTVDGLGETERAVLRAVAAGAATEGQVQAALRAADAVFHVTDLIVREVIQRLRSGPKRPLLAKDPLRLSPQGEALLAGAARHRPAPRAQGGVPVLPDPPWLWDPRLAGVVHDG
ncbi:DUF1835 domain-containing protein [Roseicella aerolata]|uniref:DUF1835 domain-containing protein n=1 Tax=Roseicella aerolata TaxID=2883479 RepID=A0A9X1IKY3_9PROT|nr:DUF1835 domain-containing protein [Roseicella aerolata]MCB4825298.1 DUF1835 domain-containing protein [Roseicella aerolata]